MKKLFSLIVIAFTVFTFTPAFAQDDGTRSVDSSVIDESLKEKGLDKAPGVVEVPKSEMLGEKPYSGWKDEDGNPISDEDYAKMQDEDKARARRNSLILVGVLLIVAAGGIGFFVSRRSGKPKA